MTAKLTVRIDRGGMPRSGILNKKFDLFLDDRPLAALGWGEKRSFNIPAGKHILNLKYRHYDVDYTLEINPEEGGVVDIDSFMNMKKGGFTIFNRADGMTSTRNEASFSQTVEVLEKSRTVAKEEWVLGFCATAGAVTFVVLNILFGSAVPGGFLGGVIGGGLGALVGMGINSFRRKK
jgi:hypothetical protein